MLWLRFLTIAKPCWTSDKRWALWAGLGLLIFLLLLQTISSVLFNRESGEFISALADKDSSRFWGSIWRYALILTAAIPVFSYYYFALDTISLRWKFKLNLFQFTHSFLTAVIPTIIIANDVPSGRLEVGLAVQAAGAFAAMQIALTVMVNHSLFPRYSAPPQRALSPTKKKIQKS